MEWCKKNVRKCIIVSSVIISIHFLIGIYFYPQMPEQMAAHWNIRGEVNGYLPKFWVLSLTLLISIGIFLLFLAIPRIDPLKYNIEIFRKYYEGLIVSLLIFLLYIDSLVISWNMGGRFRMFQALSPAIGILFYYLGILTENVKRNWFIGIRTPWTLSDENVWDKTHRLGGKLMKICGVLAMIGIVNEWLAPFFMLAPIIIVSIYLTVYSYLEYPRQSKLRANSG